MIDNREGRILSQNIAIQKIQSRANWARFARYLLKNIAIFLCALAVFWLVEKRVLGQESNGAWMGLLAPIIVSYLQWKRKPIAREQVLLWAERQIGGKGFLLLSQLNGGGQWSGTIDQNIKEKREALRPRFSFKKELIQLGLAGVFLLLCAGVPIKQRPQKQMDSILIAEEKAELLESLEELEEIIPNDSELEELREQVEKINPQDNIEAGLETLDAFSTQLEEIQSDFQKSLQETQQLLEQDYTDPAQLQKSIEPITKSLSPEMQEALQSQNYSLSEEQKKEISEQLKEKQQQLQKKSNKLTNEQLQALAEQSSTDGAGEGDENGDENGDGKGSGDPCDPADPDCKPGTGGDESAALAFGKKRQLDMSNSHMEGIRTENEVDWENTVQLGQGQGNPEQGFQDQYVEMSNGEQAQGSYSRQEIPPNQRDVVQKFFTAQKGEKK